MFGALIDVDGILEMASRGNSASLIGLAEEMSW